MEIPSIVTTDPSYLSPGHNFYQLANEVYGEGSQGAGPINDKYASLVIAYRKMKDAYIRTWLEVQEVKEPVLHEKLESELSKFATNIQSIRLQASDLYRSVETRSKQPKSYFDRAFTAIGADIDIVLGGLAIAMDEIAKAGVVVKDEVVALYQGAKEAGKKLLKTYTMMLPLLLVGGAVVLGMLYLPKPRRKAVSA